MISSHVRHHLCRVPRALVRPAARAASAAAPDELGLWINGKDVPAAGGGTLEIHNPARPDELVASVACGTATDVDTAVRAADAAFEGWAGTAPRFRSAVLHRAADLLRSALPELAQVETAATGRCLREFKAQLGRLPEWLEYHGALAQTMEGNVPPFSDEDHLCVVRRVPLGVCGLITPWNHPLLIAVKKVAVALAAGNTVVVKPPELAPVSVLRLARLFQEAGLPDGVLNVVPGYGHDAGAALAGHTTIAKVDFTGGTSTGQAIGKLAGANVKHYCAELGGNCPVIIFPDADVEEAVNGVAFGAYVASGQTCVSAKRILIHESIFDEVVQRLVHKANGLTLGDPLDMTTDMGPVISARQLEMVESAVEQGYAEGAVALAGGKRPDAARCSLTGGFYFEPTVLGSVRPDMSCFQDEIFGPVVTVTPFTDEAHAVALANDSPYGLGGAVWTSDVRRAHRVARDVRAGVFWVNAHHRNDPSAPWGGFKESGIGRENGVDSLFEYTEAKTTVVRMSDQKENWFGDASSRYG